MALKEIPITSIAMHLEDVTFTGCKKNYLSISPKSDLFSQERHGAQYFMR